MSSLAPLPPGVPAAHFSKDGPLVGRIGYGSMGLFGYAYTSKGEPPGYDNAVALIKRAYELNVRHLDTSDAYGNGDVEEKLGSILKAYKRSDWFLATKFGIRPAADGSRQVRGDAPYIRECIEGSLQRLQTSYVDLYYVHRVNRTRPVEEIWQTLKVLVEEGKVRHLDLSEASASEIERCHKVHPVAAVQLEWSLWSRHAEADIIPTCKRLGIAVVAYSPLGRGFLTGQYTSKDHFAKNDFRVVAQPRWEGEAFQTNLQLLDGFKALAARKGCSPAQLALAWLLAQGDHCFPIPGTVKISRFEENLGALSVRLTQEDLDALDQAFPADGSKVSGNRYAAVMQTWLPPGE